jgi:hypothetical protein
MKHASSLAEPLTNVDVWKKQTALDVKAIHHNL